MDKELFEKRLRELAEIVHSEDTGSWVIKKMRPQIINCDRCDQSVTDNFCKMSKQHMPFVYWRSHCKGCGMYLDPITMKPIEGPLTSTAAKVLSIIRHERKQLKLEAKQLEKVQKVEAIDKDGRSMTQETHGQVTITRYHD